MKNSPFKPIAPERIIAETDDAIAFLDGYPVSKGHTLVIAKELTASIYDLPPAVQAELWRLVADVKKILTEKYHPDGFNIGVNDGPAAGQTIAHAHIHIIPRYKGDSPDPRGGIRWVIPDKAKYWSE